MLGGVRSYGEIQMVAATSVKSYFLNTSLLNVQRGSQSNHELFNAYAGREGAFTSQQQRLRSFALRSVHVHFPNVFELLSARYESN